MAKQNYPLYELPDISNLKDMIIRKENEMPNQDAFEFARGRDQIEKRTYQRFNSDINGLGTWMHEHGIVNKHIAIIGENSYEWLVCFLAVTNGGNVAIPIDKELPANEKATMLSKTHTSVVFYSKQYKRNVEEIERLLSEENELVTVCFTEFAQCIEEGSNSISKGNKDFTDYQIDNEKLCCIMFTSGTSGTSKGVMLSQKNMAEDINGSCKLFKLGGNTMAVLPFHHAFGLVVGVFMVLNYGYTIYLNKSLKAITKDIQKAKPQTMFLVPLFVETFSKQIWMTARKTGKDMTLKRMMRISDILLTVGIDIRKKAFASVRSAFGGEVSYVICGGAPLGKQYVKEFRSWGIEILNGYGTTECAPVAAVNRNLYHEDGTVGVKLPNVEVDISEEGEVLVSGPIVMQGYYEEPEATKEVLVTRQNSDKLWYATGDLGYIDKNGFISLTGRKKNLIILSNGENVSPEELEADYLKNKVVQEIVVSEKDEMIVAEIYPNFEYAKEVLDIEGEDIFKYLEEIRNEINHGRPPYKHIAKVIMRHEEFPKNTSKKIIRY